MNKLSTQKRVQILNLLVEDMPMRTASWIAGVSINTVTKQMINVGQACTFYHREAELACNLQKARTRNFNLRHYQFPPIDRAR